MASMRRRTPTVWLLRGMLVGQSRLGEEAVVAIECARQEEIAVLEGCGREAREVSVVSGECREPKHRG